MQPVETKKDEGYFIPYQAVIRELSLLTTLRLVFDGSPETSTGISLNEVMRAGPFLSVSCLKQLADDEEERFPRAASVLREDFFVDDMLTGAETMNEAAEIRGQIIGMTNTAGLRLSKWSSNNYDLTKDLLKMRVSLDKEHSSTSRMLGVCGNTEEDTLLFEINQSSEERLISKRKILSKVAQLFDPLGLISPVIICAKISLQELWKKKLN